jgi:diacylglycerol kinase family enzyme
MTSIEVAANAKFFILLNAGSGHEDAVRTREIIEQVLDEAGRSYHLRLVEDPRRLPELARRTVQDAQASSGIVVVAGGDGTINAVVQATLGSGCPLGVLPQGTFNYFSRTHGIPFDTAEAVKVLLNARAYPVQVGMANDKLFLVNASIGLYPQLLEDREVKKQQLGRSRLVALWAALGTLMQPHRRLRLEVTEKGERQFLKTPTLFVGNNRLQMEQAGIEEAAKLEQGHLVAIAPESVGTLKMLWLMVRTALGALGSASEVRSFAFQRISVTPTLQLGQRRVKIATDGEIAWMRPPIEFRVAPERLLLLKPEAPPEPR